MLRHSLESADGGKRDSGSDGPPGGSKLQAEDPLFLAKILFTPEE